MLVAITRTDGGVSIMRIVEAKLEHNGLSAVELADIEISKWSAVDRAEVVRIYDIREADVPADRTYRNAWTHDGKSITHDMVKARNLHREILRRNRAPKLAALDIEYQRADENGDTARKRTIALQKQALRDVTNDPRIDLATTLDELKAIIPDVLKD